MVGALQRGTARYDDREKGRKRRTWPENGDHISALSGDTANTTSMQPFQGNQAQESVGTGSDTSDFPADSPSLLQLRIQRNMAENHGSYRVALTEYEQLKLVEGEQERRERVEEGEQDRKVGLKLYFLRYLSCLYSFMLRSAASTIPGPNF